ncbi:MAG: ECF-type sigma factor [Phycisphaerales bacterium]|jgi:RNA polymerase sigma factor (TIGR02999 family)|nr:ECF-type sigma factor [Phycisphaerales bacterium]
MVTDTAVGSGGLTEILNAAAAGEGEAAEAAWAAVYDDIHHMAYYALSHEAPATQLQATLLVHEVFLKLDRHHPDQWDSRRHFFGAVARCMQQYLVDHARHRSAKRRGGGRGKVSLTVVAGELASLDVAVSSQLPSLLTAFEGLEQESPRAAEIARLRYILGLTVQQAAQITGMSDRTVKKDWAYARAWLRRELDRLD